MQRISWRRAGYHPYALDGLHSRNSNPSRGRDDLSKSSSRPATARFTHAIKGNVDILIALVMNTGAAIGAQLGAISTQYFAGPKIRLAFVRASAHRRGHCHLSRLFPVTSYEHPDLQRRHSSLWQRRAARRFIGRRNPSLRSLSWHRGKSERRTTASAGGLIRED